VVEQLAVSWRAAWTERKKFHARLARVGKRRLASDALPAAHLYERQWRGRRSVAQFYRVPLNCLLVVVDDADLPLGEIRLPRQRRQRRHPGWTPSSNTWRPRLSAIADLDWPGGERVREIIDTFWVIFGADETRLL